MCGELTCPSLQGGLHSFMQSMACHSLRDKERGDVLWSRGCLCVSVYVICFFAASSACENPCQAGTYANSDADLDTDKREAFLDI